MGSGFIPAMVARVEIPRWTSRPTDRTRSTVENDSEIGSRTSMPDRFRRCSWRSSVIVPLLAIGSQLRAGATSTP